MFIESEVGLDKNLKTFSKHPSFCFEFQNKSRKFYIDPDN